jgi:TatD DNase family protein
VEAPAFIDSHCHLEVKDFGDEREAVIARAEAAGLSHFVCIGSGGSLVEIENSVALAERYPNFVSTIGIHPHDAAARPPEALDRIEALAERHPKVVAIGETGLDFYYDHSPREMQAQLFRALLGIARRTRKPVTLHIRDAHREAQEILGEERVGEIGGVVHCFTGTPEDAERYLALGLSISFSGVVTFKSAEPIREAARRVPLDRLLIETDCPYLAPVPMRGKKNEPAFLVHTARTLADLRGITLAALGAATSANTRRLFRF